jgi:hypothetical protein
MLPLGSSRYGSLEENAFSPHIDRAIAAIAERMMIEEEEEGPKEAQTEKL